MWLLGHLALGYFSALATSKYTGNKMNIPIVWVFSMLPDLDRFFFRYLIHRGPSHSIVVAVVAFIPLLLIFRQGLPYLAALMSHTLIGDYFVGQTQMFWPLSKVWYGAPPAFQLTGLTESFVEVTLFILMVAMIWFRRRNIANSPVLK